MSPLVKAMVALVLGLALELVALSAAAPAAAAEEPWSVTGKDMMKAGSAAQEWYLLGILNAWDLTRTVKCPKTVRYATIMVQARIILEENPADLAIKSLIVAMGQLGCGWRKETPERPAYKPNSK